EQVILRYADAQGRTIPEANPNGSIENIAGICNRERNVFGLMPHPDRASDARLGSRDGAKIFRSMMEMILVSSVQWKSGYQPDSVITAAAAIVGARMEKVTIDIERNLSALHTLQERVEHVVVEGTGGWLVPIRSDYFVSDLAAAMKLPVLVVAQNRLGCLNHAALTVRSVAACELQCVGLVLNSTEMASDIAALTNADILKRVLDVPLLAGLGE